MLEKRMKWVKIILLIFNVIYFISGCIVLGLGIWAVVSKLFLSHIIGSDMYATATYLLIATGAVLLIVSILGCLGTCIEVRCMMYAYFSILLVIFICLSVSAILAVVFRDKIKETMAAAMKESLVSRYGYKHEGSDDNKDVTESWDKTQIKFNCCAVDDGESWNYMIYRQSKWFIETQAHKEETKKQFVPASCCVMGEEYGKQRPVNQKQCQSFQFGPPRRDNSWTSNDALHMTGCFKAGYNYVKEQASMIIAVAFTFAVCLIIGMVLAVCYWRNIAPHEYGPTASAVV